MTNYIPHYAKKKQILARKEEDLRRLINSFADDEKLIGAAEVVRDARIRVLRAQRATIAPKDDAQEAYDLVDAQIQQLENTPLAAILLELGYIVGAPKEGTINCQTCHTDDETAVGFFAKWLDYRTFSPRSPPVDQECSANSRSMRDIPKQVDASFYSGKRSLIVPFILNDSVEIVSGEHCGVIGAVISIETISPKPFLRIECGMTGADYVVPMETVRLLKWKY